MFQAIIENKKEEMVKNLQKAIRFPSVSEINDGEERLSAQKFCRWRENTYICSLGKSYTTSSLRIPPGLDRRKGRRS